MNETLLNLNVFKKEFDKHFDDAYVLKYWFSTLLHSSTVMGAMNAYKDFGALSEAALEKVFFENDKPLNSETKSEILGAFKALPAYNDVVPAIKKLKDAGIRVIALSNSSLSMIEEQLKNADIIELFDGYYSVDDVKRYKPFNAIYGAVAEQETLALDEIVMIATHDWDLFGAKEAGLHTAYIKRKNTIYNPHYKQPDFSASELTELAQQIINSK